MNPLNFNITERTRAENNNRIASEMNRSMVAGGNTMNTGNYTARTPRLSQLLPQDRQKCEEMIFEGKGMINSSMILTSKRNRKNSQISFNQQLLQNANRSKLVDSRIMEPLKFGDKVIKGQKSQDEISKTASGIFGTPNQSPQSEHIPQNSKHLSFNSSRIINSQMKASGLRFKDSPKIDQPDKHRKSVMDFINVHTEQVMKEGESKGHHNLMKYKTSMLKPATKESLVFKGKQSYIGSQQVHTPVTSSPKELTTQKVDTAFGADHMKNFLKKNISQQQNDNQLCFKKSKEVESKDGSNSDFTACESLRSSINRLNRQDFYYGKRLGKGKFGEVFLVKHKQIGFLCAMKIISKKVILDQKIQNQLIAEIKIQQYLSHPNIAALYGVFSDEQNIYLLLEPCLEGQLYQKMKKTKRIPEKQTSGLVKQICTAIDYLHLQKIIHRDIKPQNILLSEGVIKICDFGWAAFHNDQFRDTFCGTPLYLSPELLSQDLYDDKVDNWAIGILTYEMLIGRIPFKISTKQELEKILFEEIVFPEHVDISQAAKDFILLMLQRDPTKRAQLQSALSHPFFPEE